VLFPGGPRPSPDPDDAAFWRACAEEVLVFQHCGTCDVARHPPGPRCGSCGSTSIEWRPTAAQGVVYSYTIVHHPMHPSAAQAVPYVVVLVEFGDVPGVRLATDLIGEDRLDVRIGDEVEIVWSRLDASCALPLAARVAAPATPAASTITSTTTRELT
jgi:hypothetical protein